MEINSISFFNPDARKVANPDEHPCPECGCEMKPKEACTSDGHDNSWYIVGWVCKCGYEEKVKT